MSATNMRHPESAALQEWVHAGLRCMIASNGSGHVNGYVQVPEGHVAYGQSYGRVPVDVHGGLTFAERGWFGFDTAHAGDAWTAGDLARAGVENPAKYEKYRSPIGTPRYWTVELLHRETESLAEQLADLTELPEPDRWEITDEELSDLRAERDRLRAIVATVQSAVGAKS